MVSQQLFEQWRVRLAEWQQRLDEGRPRPWLARASVRVLSFLLKQYVPGESAADRSQRTQMMAGSAQSLRHAFPGCDARHCG